MTPRLSALANKYGADVLLPLSTIASGGGAATASMQLLGGVLVTKVLGPMGAIAGILGSIVLGMKNWAVGADVVGRAMQKAAAKEQLVKDFAEVTKSVAVARARLQDLFSFAQKAPFRFDSIIEGGRALAAVSNGSLVTKKNLALVGDAAAASGQQFGTIAGAVANVYEALKSGQPIAASADALKNLGLFSQATVDQLTSLQGVGANLGTTFDVATKALQSNKGAMADVVQTVEDLTQKQEQLKAGILAPVGQIYNDAQKKGLEAQNALLEKLAPTLTTVGSITARTSTIFGYLQDKFVGWLASLPGVGKAFGAIAAVFAILVGQVSLLVAAKFGDFFLKQALGAARYAKSLRDAATATQLLNAAQTQVGAGANQLKNFGSLAASELSRKAAGGLGPELPPGMLTGALGGGLKDIAQGGAARGFQAFFGAVKSGFAYLVEGAAALLSPLGLITLAVAALAGGAVYLGDKFFAANDEISAMGAAATKTNETLREHIRNIRTAADAATVLAEATDAATTAQENYDKVKAGRSTLPIIGGLINAANQQGTKELTASNAVGDAKAAQYLAQKLLTNGALARSPEQNEAELGLSRSSLRSEQEAEMAMLSPTQQVGLLDKRYKDAVEEMGAKNVTQAQIARVVDPNGKGKDQVQDLLKNSGSLEMRQQGQLLAIPDTPENALQRQNKQNQIALTQERLGDAAGKSEAAEAKLTEVFNRDQEASRQKGVLDLQRSIEEVTAAGDARTLTAAQLKLGALKAQLDLIDQSLTMTDKEKENAREALVIEAMRAAAVQRRSDLEQKMSQAQLASKAAGVSGNARGSQDAANAANAIDDNIKYTERVAALTKQGTDAGLSKDAAEAKAKKDASALGQQDVLSRAIDKVQNIPNAVRGAAGTYGIDTSHLLTDGEKKALTAAGIPFPGMDSGGSLNYDNQLGGASPLDQTSGHGLFQPGSLGLGPVNDGTHHTMGDLLGDSSSSLKAIGPASAPTDPLLSVQTQALTTLQTIAKNTGGSDPTTTKTY